jgi:hypothetical protein
MFHAFATRSNLRAASRLPTLSDAAKVSAVEIACLLACGALAALATGLLHWQLRVPGHAILRGVLPIALGLALVPRRSAGMVMSVGATLTAGAMSWGHIGRFPPAAMLGILAFGPVLDVALSGQVRGWRLYLRMAAAGAVANLLAFAIRFATAVGGWDISGPRYFMSFWSTALVTFILCGLIAGLISAAVWFRLRVSYDLRRD